MLSGVVSRQSSVVSRVWFSFLPSCRLADTDLNVNWLPSLRRALDGVDDARCLHPVLSSRQDWPIVEHRVREAGDGLHDEAAGPQVAGRRRAQHVAIAQPPTGVQLESPMMRRVDID